MKATKVFNLLVRRTKQLPRNIERLSKLDSSYKSTAAFHETNLKHSREMVSDIVSNLKRKISPVEADQLRTWLRGRKADMHEELAKYVKAKNTPNKRGVILKEIAMGAALPSVGIGVGVGTAVASKN